jgi:hypothetical protein
VCLLLGDEVLEGKILSMFDGYANPLATSLNWRPDSDDATRAGLPSSREKLSSPNSSRRTSSLQLHQRSRLTRDHRQINTFQMQFAGDVVNKLDSFIFDLLDFVVPVLPAIGPGRSGEGHPTRFERTNRASLFPYSVTR